MTLDEALGGAHAQFIKIKIDGGGADVISGAERLLRRSRPTLTVMIFEPEREIILESLLVEFGYHAMTPEGLRLDRDAVGTGGDVVFVHPDGPVRGG